MGTEFENASAVRRVTADEGRLSYEAAIAPGWDIAGNANGGYLIAVAARAMADAVGRPPLSVTAHYLSPGKPGPVTIDVEVVRDGRRMAVVRASMISATGPVLSLLGTFADHPVPGSGPAVIDGAPPEVPAPEECVAGGPPNEVGESGFGDRVIGRYHPADAGFREGRPSGTARMRGWFEFADGGHIDAFGLLVALDAFAPVCFNRPEFAVSWAPTIELTAHVRAEPAPGPLRVLFSSRFLQDGMFEEDGEIWDSAGRLVAQSRQLALLPRSPGV
ncbi:MAG: thioesterase family protein [Ilumatobacteraceae bacterium]